MNVDQLINMSQSQLLEKTFETQTQDDQSKLVDDYMQTLSDLNKQKDQLNDVDQYHMSPCRYIQGNRQIGDMRVPWKLVKHKAILDEENERNQDQT